jgi:hypothetical protein
MGESTDRDTTEGSSPTLASFVSRDLLGIVLLVAGAYGSLVLPGRSWMVSAGINGIGAILVFTSDATTSTNSAGYLFALLSWSLLALNGMETRVVIPTMVAGFWFGFEAEQKLAAEMLDS